MLADVRRSGGMSNSAFPPVMHTHFLGAVIACWEIKATEARRRSSVGSRRLAGLFQRGATAEVGVTGLLELSALS